LRAEHFKIELSKRSKSQYSEKVARVRSGKIQGKKLFLDKGVSRFRLPKRVPPLNLYRQVAERIDGVNFP